MKKREKWCLFHLNRILNSSQQLKLHEFYSIRNHKENARLTMNAKKKPVCVHLHNMSVLNVYCQSKRNTGWHRTVKHLLHLIRTNRNRKVKFIIFIFEKYSNRNDNKKRSNRWSHQNNNKKAPLSTTPNYRKWEMTKTNRHYYYWKWPKKNVRKIRDQEKNIC